MIGAARSGTDIFVRGEEEDERNFFIELYHFMAVELMLLCIL